ncbi:spindle pole component 29, partial [Striga asiatica]
IEPDELRGKRKRSTCPYKLKKQQTIIRCSKCHETCHNALRWKVTTQNTEGLGNSSDAPQKQKANANANIPIGREKLTVTKKNTDGVVKSCDAPQQQQKVHANANILPPRADDLMNSVISDTELMAAIDNY